MAIARAVEMEAQLEDDVEQQQEELESLLSIYSNEITVLERGREFLVRPSYSVVANVVAGHVNMQVRFIIQALYK